MTGRDLSLQLPS